MNLHDNPIEKAKPAKATDKAPLADKFLKSLKLKSRRVCDMDFDKRALTEIGLGNELNFKLAEPYFIDILSQSNYQLDNIRISEAQLDYK